LPQVASKDENELSLFAATDTIMASVEILTTTVGSLPRPPWMVPYLRGEKELPADWEHTLHKETIKVMKEQLDVGLKVINDGELGRGDYVSEARKRMKGFDAEAIAPGAADLEEATEYSDKFEGRKGLLTLTKKTEVKAAACSAPPTYTEEGLEDLKKEINRVVSAAKELGHPLDRVFFTSPSPGTLATFFGNEYYKGKNGYEDFVSALGKAMAVEYKTIQEAGLILQLDCPDLGMGRHTRHMDKTTEEFKKVAQWHVKVLNEAVASLNTAKIRMHMCWGNYPGPHDKDIPLKEIANIVLEAKPELLSVEACNPGHAHEHEVWGKDNVNVPEKKTFLPGVIDTTSSHVEHPELVKQRLRQYVDALRLAKGKRERENGADSADAATKKMRCKPYVPIMACTDCGFGTAAGANNLSRDLVFKKIGSMCQGAKLLEEELAAENANDKSIGA
jgi:5-methyltetrahydropteroyltriglutamate--homocysteine methyltransferase